VSSSLLRGGHTTGSPTRLVTRTKEFTIAASDMSFVFSRSLSQLCAPVRDIFNRMVKANDLSLGMKAKKLLFLLLATRGSFPFKKGRVPVVAISPHIVNMSSKKRHM